MLDQTTRAAILKLHEAGHGRRAIARALGISRNAVREVLAAGSAEVPRVIRTERAEPFYDDILTLYAECKGNLIRVHEEIEKRGAKLSYPAFTAYCRRHGIGRAPPQPSGQYSFEPGQEMQHDTSPHDAHIGGRLRRVQTASLVLCFSRLIFFQLYPFFTRFICKVFLADALRYFGGACAQCMIDNTGVIVLSGTGRDMIPVPEMAAFGERYGFVFRAHEKGDANRSARVEGPFNHIEKNFLAGRKFADFDEANREAVAWCDRINAKFSTKLHASRCELFAKEKTSLVPLPIWVPEVYELHHRIVDVEGFVSVRRTRYSAPYQLIGRQLEVRATKSEIQFFDGPRLVATHRRSDDPNARIVDPAHRPPRGHRKPEFPIPEERALLDTAPEIATYVQALKTKTHGRGTNAIRRLLRIARDYPRPSFLEAMRVATHYGLFDLERLERMVLRNVHRDFFPHDADTPPGHDPRNDDDEASR